MNKFSEESQKSNEPLPLKSYSQIFSDVSRTAKILVLNDIKLVNQDLKRISKDVKHNARSVTVFGAIFLISSIPLIIFSIILLGEILDHQYWLSSLILGITLFVIGSVGSTYFYHKLKQLDFKFNKTRAALKKESEIIYRQFNKFQQIAEETIKEGQGAAK